MNPDPREPSQDVLDFLLRRNFNWISGWNFEHGGNTYDLSAADITQIDKIVENGLFLKAEAE